MSHNLAGDGVTGIARATTHSPSDEDGRCIFRTRKPEIAGMKRMAGALANAAKRGGGYQFQI